MPAKTILALSGPGNTGKTTTIALLYQVMVQSHFNDTGGNFGKFNDFWCVFDKNGQKIGVTSLGDSYSVLENKLDILNAAGCRIIVCACRSWGQTIDLLEDKVGFHVEYIDKTRANSAKQSEANNKDASTILNKIKQLMQ